MEEARGGLVLVQEIFGVTDHIRELCDEYAADGYEVLSPALFDREHPGFESDYSGPQFERAVQLARSGQEFSQVNTHGAAHGHGSRFGGAH